MSGDFQGGFDRIRTLLAAVPLPGVVEATSYGTPALKVAGRFLARLKDETTLVVWCPIEEKDLLIEAEPALFYQTDHYQGWPALLVRLDRIGDARLCQVLERAWRLQAPKRLLAARDAAG